MLNKIIIASTPLPAPPRPALVAIIDPATASAADWLRVLECMDADAVYRLGEALQARAAARMAGAQDVGGSDD